MRPQDFLTHDEFTQLKAAIQDDRQKAIVLALAGTGIRVNELCNIKVEDIDFDHGYIHIEIAKGNRPRTVVAPKPTLDALQVHLQGRDSGFVFIGRQAGHISTRQVERILDEIATKAGLQDMRHMKQRDRKRISPHLLRHSAASWWLDAGIHIGDVAQQLGHASLSTTTRYVDRAPNHRVTHSTGPT
ncbi:MAG: site-specific integrase [Methanotrichaceae archaeon]|jgi:integrase/recombinase XerD